VAGSRGDGLSAAKRHMDRVAKSGCVVGRRFGGCEGRNEVHHVAEGSGLRSDFAVACLCAGHHRGGVGIHGLGSKAFIRMYRPPGETEYGLLVWQNEDLAKA
jgi:hypothetical protein